MKLEKEAIALAKNVYYKSLFSPRYALTAFDRRTKLGKLAYKFYLELKKNHYKDYEKLSVIRKERRLNKPVPYVNYLADPIFMDYKKNFGKVLQNSNPNNPPFVNFGKRNHFPKNETQVKILNCLLTTK